MIRVLLSLLLFCATAQAQTITTSPSANGTAAVGQLPGTTTNDNAAAGKVGEIISSSIASGSAVALTSGVTANLTSLNLTAGDWDVSCTTSLILGATTNATFSRTSISLITATLDGSPGSITNTVLNGVLGNAVDDTFLVGPVRESLGTTTPVFCTSAVSFTVSTASIYGFMRARRVR